MSKNIILYEIKILKETAAYIYTKLKEKNIDVVLSSGLYGNI